MDTTATTMRERAQEAEQVLARTDHTNAVLAALATALLVAGAAGIGFTGGDATLPTTGRVLMGAALLTVAAALLLLLAAIRPRHGVPGSALSGVPAYAQMSAGQLLVLETDQGRQAYFIERTRTVSRIAVSKHRQQRRAIALMAAAVAVMVIAVLVTLT